MELNEKKKVLIVDDEENIRKALLWRLQQLGFDTIEASNAADGQSILEDKRVDLVITDVYMPGSAIDGIALLKFAKSKTTTPVIVMTGFSKLIEAKSAADIGADGFLTKPFTDEELTDKIGEIFGTRPVPLQNDDDFYSISIDHFLSGETIRYDIYIRIAAAKFVKVARKGEVVSIDRVTRYTHKGVRYLHINREDYKDYICFSLGISNVAKDRKIVPAAKVKQLVSHSTEMIGRFVAHEEISPEVFSMASKTLENTLACVASDEELGDLLSDLSNQDDVAYAHCLGVSLYAVMIAKKFGWNSPKLLNQLGLAGMFHDVGKKELSAELLAKPRSRMTPDDVHMYESHVIRSVRILQEMNSVPEVVIQAIAQHHEDLIGTGYPNRLTKVKISPMGQMLAVADSFTSLVVTPNKSARVTPSEAINRMRMLQKESLNASFVNLLESCLNVKSNPANPQTA